MSDAAAGGRPDSFGLVGTVLQEQFEIQLCVAEGGFGVVYYALQRPFGRPVALKVLKLPEDMGPKTRRKVEEAFLEEGRITAALDIPGIVQALSAGVLERPDGERHPWLALQWISGPTLRKWLLDRRRQTPGPMSPREALALMRPVFVALGRAHREHRIAHRDIKPGNIMVVEKDGHRDLYVVDFGIAKSMEADETPDTVMTRVGGLGFSPEYAAREQLVRRRTGPWTDVHALALIMTELLVDGSAYRGANRPELMNEIVSPQRPTPGKFGVDVGPWEQVLARALSLETRNRYADALEFLAALESALGDGAKPAASISDTIRSVDVAKTIVTPSPVGAMPAADMAKTFAVASPLEMQAAVDAARVSAAAPVVPTPAVNVPAQPVVPRARRGRWLALAVLAGVAILGVGAFSLRRGRGEQAPEEPAAGAAPVRPVAPVAEARPVATGPTASGAAIPPGVGPGDASVAAPAVATAPSAPAPPPAASAASREHRHSTHRAHPSRGWRELE